MSEEDTRGESMRDFSVDSRLTKVYTKEILAGKELDALNQRLKPVAQRHQMVSGFLALLNLYLH